MLTREVIKRIIDDEMDLLRSKINREMELSTKHILNKLNQKRGLKE